MTEEQVSVIDVKALRRAPDDAKVYQIIGDCFVTTFRTLRPLDTIDWKGESDD